MGPAAVQHLLRRYSEGVGISVAAFTTALFEPLSALFHFLLALCFERLVFLALFVGQELHHLCVRPRALDGGVAFGQAELIGVLPDGAFVLAVLDGLVERLARLHRTLERLFRRRLREGVHFLALLFSQVQLAQQSALVVADMPPPGTALSPRLGAARGNKQRDD